MKIATRLKLNALLFAAVVFIISMLFAMMFKVQREAFEISTVVDGLMKGSYELNSLSNRYLRYPGERPKEQWVLVYEELAKDLKGSALKQRVPAVIINRMSLNLNDIRELFDSLVQASEKTGAGSQPPVNSAASEDRRRQIADLIVKRTRDVTLDSGRLASLLNEEILNINRQIMVLVPVIAVLLTAVTAWLSLRIGRSISTGINTLRAGAEAVGSGKLDYRIGLRTPDELGLLSQAFDHMTGSLQALTVSRDELSKEIAERRKAEEALRRSEAILKQAGQMARLGAWEIEFLHGNDPNENQLHWSDEVYRIFGYEPGAVALSNELFFERVHPEDRRPIMDAVSNAIAAKTPYSIEHRIVRPDGAERIVYEHAEIVFENGGRPARIIGAVQDITERKQIEQALKQNERFLNAVIENAPACVKLVAADGTLLMMNRAGLSMIGADSAGQVQGKSIYPIVSSHHRHAFIALTNKVFEGKSGKLEFEAIDLKGRHIWLNTHAVPLFDNRGNITALLGITIDISDRKKAELALEQSNRELERYLAQLQTIFDNLTDGLVVADLNGNLFQWNPAAVAMHGFASLEECQRRLPEFAGIFELSTAEEGVLPLEQWPLARILHGETLHAWEVDIRRQGTDWKRVFSYGGTLARDRDGKPLLAVVIVSDITERKRRDEELKRVSRQNELILEYAGEGIFGLDLQGNVTFVNAVAAHMLGYNRKELLGSHSHRTWHYQKADSSPYPSEECPIYAAYNEGRIHSGEETFWRKDGTGFPVDFTSRPIYEEGKITGAVVLYRDITERKRAEEELREREERFRALYEQAGVGIELRALNGKYMRGNGKLSQMLGYSEKELQQMTFAQITHPEDLLNEKQLLDRLVAGGIPSYSIEKRYLHKTGIDIWVRVTSSIARTSKPYRISIIEDITERKKAEEELKKLLAELERSNKELEQFAYVASHDLQEPLRMVASYVQLFEKKYKGQLDGKADRYIFFAVDGVKRMQKLIDGLLAYSRVARGAKFATVDTNRAFDQALLNLSVAVDESGATITREELPSVFGDETQLTQLFQNLIGNGIKFRKPDVPPTVHVSAERREKEWVVSVRDNGIGIDPQYTQRIFLIFQRLHARDEYPGTGIGLALCKRIVERHRGRIWVESTPGQGSTFFFTLPVSQKG